MGEAARTRHVSASVALAVGAVLVVGCTGTTGSDDRTRVAGAAVAVAGLDPSALLAAIPDAATAGWQVAGAGEPVPVTLDDVRLNDGDRADRYAEAGYVAGARLSLARGDADRLAVMVDRFPNAAAARQVGDWHLSSRGFALEEDGVSRIGATAEGMVVLQDLVVRVVGIGEQAPDDTVRRVLDAVEAVVTPRA